MNYLKHFALVLLAVLNFSFIQKDTDHFEFRKKENNAFTYGEELEYRVHYGILNAASISVKVDEKPTIVNGRSTYHITAKGRTNSSFDWMYRVRDHFETYMDSQSMAPLKYFKSVRENKYKDLDLVYYDHEKEYLKGRKKNMAMPAYVQDIVSALFYSRTLDFKNASIGETFPIDIYLDQTVYNLKFKYLGQETIKTDLGKLKCYKMRPQLVVDRVFKDEDDMTVWVTADANQVPVRVQTDIWVGSLKVDLTSYKNLANPLRSKVN